MSLLGYVAGISEPPTLLLLLLLPLLGDEQSCQPLLSAPTGPATGWYPPEPTPPTVFPTTRNCLCSARGTSLCPPCPSSASMREGEGRGCIRGEGTSEAAP